MKSALLITLALSTSACVILTLSTPALTADWPQWQGPNRDGISPQTGLLKTWPEDGPPVAWKVTDLGGGYSAPAVANGKLYGMSSRGDEEVVWCRSEADGSELWATPVEPALREGMPQGREGSGCTPTIDGEQVYVIGLGGVVACLQRESGEIVWKRNLIEDFGGILPTWRYNESPLVDGDKVICTPGGPEATLVALNKESGELIWQSVVPTTSSSNERNADRNNDRNNDRDSDNRRPSPMQIDPILSALDADKDRTISTAELEKSATVLRGLDKNTDGKLTEEEVTANTPDRGDRGGREERGGRGDRGDRGSSRGRSPRGGAMRFMPVNKALDADENSEISTAELDAAPIALNTLDKNKDGSLEESEVTPQFGSRGPSSGAAYASAIAIDFAGQRQYVQLTATTVVGVSATDGTVLWQYDHPANQNRINCTTPIFHEGLVVAASAYGNGGGAAKLVQDGDSFKAEEVWFSSSMQNHHGGMIIHEGCLYGANGGNGGGFLCCLDLQNGDILWRDRDAPKGSLIFADDRLYLYSEEGEVLLVEPSREKFIEHGRFKHPNRSESPAWTHPVIANGKLYIRDQSTLFCYDVATAP